MDHELSAGWITFDFIVQSQISDAQHRTWQLELEIKATIRICADYSGKASRKLKLNEERQRLIEAAPI